MWWRSQRFSRSCTRSRSAPLRLSSASTIRRGAIEAVAFGEVGDDFAAPAQLAVGRQHELFVGRAGEAVGALGDLGGDDLGRGAAQRLGVGFAIGARQGEAEALDRADKVTFEADLAAVVDFGR